MELYLGPNIKVALCPKCSKKTDYVEDLCHMCAENKRTIADLINQLNASSDSADRYRNEVSMLIAVLGRMTLDGR